MKSEAPSIVEVRNMTNKEYHSETGYISSSMIKRFIESRRLFHDEYIIGNPRPRKSAFDLGNAAHAMILEPHKVDKIVKEIPDDILSASGSKAGKSWKQFESENEGIILLKSSEMAAVKSMLENAYKNESAKKLLKAKGETEESFFQSNGWGRS